MPHHWRYSVHARPELTKKFVAMAPLLNSRGSSAGPTEANGLNFARSKPKLAARCKRQMIRHLDRDVVVDAQWRVITELAVFIN